MSNIPLLRFPGFKGQWEEKKVGDISIKIGSGNTPNGGEKVYKKEGVIFIRSQNVNNDQLILDDVVYIPQDINEKMGGSIVRPKDILLNITGASLGRSCVVPDDFIIGNVNQHVCIIRLNDENSSKFLQPYLSSSRGQKLMSEGQTGSGREGLNFQSVRGFKVYLPVIKEQAKIASFLSAVDEKLQVLKKRRLLLQQYKEGVMQKIFAQEIRFKDDEGNEFEEWEEKSLEDITDRVSDGYHGTPDYDISGDYYFINGNNLINNQIVINGNTKKVNEGQYKIHKRLLNENTILLSINGTIGSLAYYNDEQVVLGKSVCYINLKEGISKHFVYHQLKSERIKNLFFSELTGTTIKNLSLTTIKKTVINIPKIKEQTKIANFLSAIDDKINHCQIQIAATEQYKKALLQQMFC